MKKFLLNILFLNSFCYAINVSDLVEPMPLEGRLSNTNKVESRKVQVVKKDEQKAQLLPTIDEKKISEKSVNETNSNYADLSLKRIADDIAWELEEDSMEINSDIATLWSATVDRSETMKYAIYKLSNPEEDKPNESTMKKILKPIANFSSIAGASVAGDPIVATSALIGGGLVNAFMKDDKEINYRFSKVSDADMVLLVRKIDELQKKLLDLYVDYKTKEKLAKMTQENFEKREEIYKLAQNKSKEELTIADVYYRKAKTASQKAQDEYMTSRAILENLVGIEALKKIEQ
ncbi:MAG: hypothetical protein IJB79_09270 [Candidatus Gastranaerophilales bacterium]|nr:hypothetical protein [bacterium]MBQ4647524.1 hypothetical protein [Candidatus Gastranaerophilales bacterium]